MNDRTVACLRRVRRAGLWTLLALPLPISAQTTPTRQQAEPFAPERQTPPPASASVDSSRALDTAPCPVETSPLKVTLTGIDFVAPGTADAPDGTAVPPVIATLLSGVRAPAGEQPISVVCSVRDRASAVLRDAGYVASVQIPAQEIASGRLRLVVVTAKIVEMRIVGDVGRFRDTIEARAAAIKALDPLNKIETERLLLLAGDVPGLKLRLTLKSANRAPGEVIGELTADTQSFSLLANIQNYGSRQLGREILSVRGEAYGLTGHADRTFIALSNSLQWHETHVVQAGHDMGIGDAGFRVGVRGSYALSNPSIPNIDLRTNSLIAGLDLSMPLLRAVDHDLRASGGFELLDQRTVIRQSGTDAPFAKDRLRVLFARLDGEARVLGTAGNEVWSVGGYAQVRQGINVFNASRRGVPNGAFPPSRFDGDPQATVISGELSQTLHPVPLLAIGAAVFGQWSNHALLNFEEFSLGNLTYGRGYDPGANGADRVIAARVEPRLRLPFTGDNVAVELTGFYDWVRIYNLDQGTTETRRNLRSAGGGIRVTLPNQLVLDVTYAKPLDFALRTDIAKPTDRVLVSLTAKLFPWGARR